MPTRRSWLRLGGNLLAAFLVGDGLMVAFAPRRQTLLWSPVWSPALWRRPLRALARRPGLTRLLALGEVVAGLGLARWTNAHPEDR